MSLIARNLAPQTGSDKHLMKVYSHSVRVEEPETVSSSLQSW